MDNPRWDKTSINSTNSVDDFLSRLEGLMDERRVMIEYAIKDMELISEEINKIREAGFDLSAGFYESALDREGPLDALVSGTYGVQNVPHGYSIASVVRRALQYSVLWHEKWERERDWIIAQSEVFHDIRNTDRNDTISKASQWASDRWFEEGAPVNIVYSHRDGFMITLNYEVAGDKERDLHGPGGDQKAYAYSEAGQTVKFDTLQSAINFAEERGFEIVQSDNLDRLIRKFGESD